MTTEIKRKHKVIINERWEYDYVVDRGYEPLINPIFVLDHDLRVHIQNELFSKSFIGKTDVARGNIRFYHWVWDKGGPVRKCEECNDDLLEYNSMYISHILSRKAYPEIAYDPRNVNFLCGWCHHKWETKPKDMKIYSGNLIIIDRLKKEYVHKPAIVEQW